MTRTDNVKTNLIFNVIKFTANIILQFIVRTALIYFMGVEYIGLNGLFANIFSFLNLAELGIGSAIAFSMYKPVAEGDIEKIKSLQALHRKFYSIIFIVVLCLGLAVLPFIKYLINGGVTADTNVYMLYILYLINTLVCYFSAHKRSLLFAYQRNDIENKIKTFCVILMSILQIVVLFIFRNYYLYFTVTILFSLIDVILIKKIANKMYPEINGKSAPLDSYTKKQISQNITALGLHKACGALIYSTDNILISAILGIALLGVYSNYYLIITTLLSIYTLLSNAIGSSVGNMIASESKEYVYSKFKQINFLFSILTSFCTVCLIVLFQPFITIWTGGGIYLLNFSTVILISISFYVVKIRHAVIIFKDSAGLFWENRFSPIIEAILNLVISIVLGISIGINGIILGTILSAILAPMIFEPRVLYKHYFKKSVWNYFKSLLIDIIITSAVGTICYVVCSFIPDGGIWLLIAKFATCVPLCGILLLITYSPTKEFKELFMMGKNFVKGLFPKNKTK